MIFAYNNPETDEYGWQEHWGVKFKWTPEHLTPKDLEPLIHTYDTVATEAVKRLDEISPPSYSRELLKEPSDVPLAEKRPRRDLYELLQKHAATDEKVRRLWSEINFVPSWVDWAQIERGQKVFYRYGGPAITAVSKPELEKIL